MWEYIISQNLFLPITITLDFYKPSRSLCPIWNDVDCEMFLSYFTGKAESFRVGITLSATYYDTFHPQQHSSN